MRHILFEIPLPFGDARLPVFGFGLMLVIAFFSALKLAEWRGKKEGISKDTLWDLALWVFGFGLLGARLTSMIIDPVPGDFWQQCLQFFKIWEGGMVIFGGIPGGLLGYVIAYYRILKPLKLRTLQIADLAAPSLALGLALGRIGCLLNGCCYGDVADPYCVPEWRTLQFPSNSPPHYALIAEGYQTGFGFIPEGVTVQFVEPGSPAARAGLQPGDVIKAVGGMEVRERHLLKTLLLTGPRGAPLELTVERLVNGVTTPLKIVFTPSPSLPMHPTQLYSAINGFLIVLVLLAFQPFRRHEGAVIALLMILKGITRFLLEALRLDNPPTFTGLTVSQNIAIVLVAGGVVLMLWVQTRPLPPANAPTV
jgi:phosphatidylglycerol---prolipoprotein diacylglyceryl transferase